jgi:hypothetical protein
MTLHNEKSSALAEITVLRWRTDHLEGPIKLGFRVAGLHPRLASKCTESRLQGYREAGL